MKIKVNIDQKAALLAGKELQSQEIVDISKDACADPLMWPHIVEMLDMRETPPTLTCEYSVEDATQSGVERAVARKLAEAQAKQNKKEQKYRDKCAACEPVKKRIFAIKNPAGKWEISLSCGLLVSESGLEFSQPSTYYVDDHIARKVDAEFAEKFARLTQQVAAHNAAEFERCLPAALAAEEKRVTDKIAADKIAAETNEAKIAALAAKRLETGYWERETPSYDECRYSAPWVASVSFADGAKPIYTFGDSTGKWGQPGLLRVQCKPGEIIAHGQKNLPRPGDSDHTLLVMRKNGRMTKINQTEAFRIWTERKGVKKTLSPAGNDPR